MTLPKQLRLHLDDELREQLLGASRDELESLRRARPELAPLIDRLLATETEVSLWLDDVTAPGAAKRTAVRWVLAAAAVAGIAITGSMMLGPHPLTPPADVVQLPAPFDAPLTDLDVEAEGNFVVFPTQNPDIAVVWLLNGDD